MKVERIGEVKVSQLPKHHTPRKDLVSPAPYIPAIYHGGSCSVEVLSYIREPSPEEE